MEIRLPLFFAVFFSCGAAHWTIQNRMLAKANRLLPEKERISRSYWSHTGLESGGRFQLWKTYRRFFPGSSLVFFYPATFIFTVLWLVFGVIEFSA